MHLLRTGSGLASQFKGLPTVRATNPLSFELLPKPQFLPRACAHGQCGLALLVGFPICRCLWMLGKRDHRSGQLRQGRSLGCGAGSCLVRAERSPSRHHLRNVLRPTPTWRRARKATGSCKALWRRNSHRPTPAPNRPSPGQHPSPGQSWIGRGQLMPASAHVPQHRCGSCSTRISWSLGCCGTGHLGA